MTYDPQPIDTSAVELPRDLRELSELLAENAHDVWAQQRIADGWVYGPQRDDGSKQHPCLIPYSELPEEEQHYDRILAENVLKVIRALGYQLAPPVSVDTESPGAQIVDAYAAAAQLLEQMRAAEDSDGELGVLLAAWDSHRGDAAMWRVSVALYQQLGRRLLRLGAAPLAAEVARAGRAITLRAENGQRFQPWENDVLLRQILGLALARLASPREAQRLLLELYDEGHRDSETLGILARTFKDLAYMAPEAAEQQRLLERAAELYGEVFEKTGEYWHGINLATLTRINGDVERASALAARVQQLCEEDLQAVRARSGDTYWALATLGEAALVQGKFDDAERYYREAADVVGKRYGDLNSTRRHAQWLLETHNRDRREVDQWLPLPKVVVFAGHMIDRAGREQPRFPEHLAPDVKAALKKWLEDNNARIGYSSAACGSDILFQEAIHELQGEGRVILPYDREDFLQDSVQLDGASESWQERFETVWRDAVQVITASPRKMRYGGVSYDYANLMIHGLATVRARQLGCGDPIGLAVWDGQRGDGPGGTSSIVARWLDLGMQVHHLDPRAPLQGNQPAVTATRPANVAPPRRVSGGIEASTQIMAMLFGDAVNFSKLEEEQVPRFVQHFLGELGRMVRADYGQANVVRNTWGDGLYLVFNSVRDAGCCALEFCDFVRSSIDEGHWEKLGLPAELNVRLALHAGPVFRCEDPLTGQPNYTGTHVSRAARLEPKTPPGAVYASEAFAALAEVEGVTEFRCVYVKQLEWAKHYGSFPTYVLQWNSRDPAPRRSP